MATFNVNNITKRLLNLLASSQPDVACLQELKSTDAAFPADVIGPVGYGAA
jgi:exodeoxyribonuclease III